MDRFGIVFDKPNYCPGESVTGNVVFQNGKALKARYLKVSISVLHRLNEALENPRLLCTMAVDHRFAYIQKWITPKSWTLVELDLEKYLKDEPLSGKSTPYTSPNEEDIEEFMNSSVVSSESKSDKIQVLRFLSHYLITYYSRCTDILRQTKRNRAKLETLNELLTIKELTRLDRIISIISHLLYSRSEGEENGTDDDEFFADSDEETSDEEPEESDVDDAEMNKRYSNETVSPLSEPSSPITDT
uniref:Set apart in position or space protein n=1 Tax=Caenorhabditis tropicalis TaxID=1561998 RepID=A0A1I7TRM1_9PELO